MKKRKNFKPKRNKEVKNDQKLSDRRQAKKIQTDTIAVLMDKNKSNEQNKTES